MKNVIDSNAVYTYQQMEDILGITKRTLSSYVDAKELKPIIFGNKYRFLGSEILRFLVAKMNSSITNSIVAYEKTNKTSN